MEEKVLMDLDRQFCKDFNNEGAKGWAKYFWEDGYMVTGKHLDNIEGRDNIEKAMSNVEFLEDLVFTWEPMKCEMSKDSTMGYTMGKYYRSFTKDGNKIEQTGKYTTIWTKRDGVWKIAMDTGN